MTDEHASHHAEPDGYPHSASHSREADAPAESADPVDAFAQALRTEIASLTEAKALVEERRRAVEQASRDLDEAVENYQKSYAATVKRGYPEAVLAQVGIENLAPKPAPRSARKTARRAARKARPAGAGEAL